MLRSVSMWLLSLFFIACATTGMQKKEEEAPLRTQINAPKDKIYQITANKLMEYGFELESSDAILGRITTKYVTIEPGFGRGVLLGMVGVENLKASITTQILESDSTYCELIMRGVVQYAQDKGLSRIIDDEDYNERDIKYQPVRKDTYVYGQMQEISATIKEEAEQ